MLARLITKPLKAQAREFNTGKLLLLVSSLLALLALGVAVWSIQKADWVRPEPLLVITLVLAAVAGILLTKVRWPFKWLFPTVVLLGVFVTVGQSILIFNGNEQFSALQQWWQTVTGSRPNDAPIYFVMFLFFVTWIIGWFSFWSLWRSHTGWVTVILGLVVMLVNVSNLTRENYYYFFFFFLPAIPLLAFTHLLKQNVNTTTENDRGLLRSLIPFSIVIIVITVLVAGTAYVLPEPPLDKVSLNIDSGRLDLTDKWFNVFSTIRSKWTSLRSHNNEELLFKNGIDTSDTINFVVFTEDSNYWAVRRYDTYNAQGWYSQTRQEQSDMATGAVGIPDNAARDIRELSYTVESRLRTDVILTQGFVQSIDVPYHILVFDAPVSSPPPLGMVDIAAFVSETTIAPYKGYTVTTRAITFSPEELRAAGQSYPLWVVNRYLQLPDDYPVFLRTLGDFIIQNAATPYDKALAIKKYLNQFPYDLETPPPSENTDAVAYFLISAKRGYCTHFASAMATLLRSVGVPTRLVTGYLRGDYDSTTGSYLILGRNFHSWIEIYFPDIGWVEFEATPANEIPPSVDVPIVEPEDNYAFNEENILPPWMQDLTEPDFPVQPPAIRPKTFPVIWFYIFGLAALFLLAVFILRMVMNSWMNRLRTAGTPSDVYEQMAVLAEKGDVHVMDCETPSEFGRKLAKRITWQEENIREISNYYFKEKYSREKILNKQEYRRLRKAWLTLIPSLMTYMLRLRKWTLIRWFWKPE